MTTATTVAGLPLSAWTRDARHGTWHALLPAQPGEPVRGALRVDHALLTPEGTRERLATAVLATAKLRLPGLLGTVDLVAEAGEVWLITARPPAPVLADVLSADGPRPDAGSAASVLNETTQTLLALHAAGLAHGSLGPRTVVLAPDGVALLAEAALATALGDTPAADLTTADTEAADTQAWAALARTLGAAWATAGTPAADLFTRCATTAETEGLAAARTALVSGRACLPSDFLRRTALRTAATRTSPDFAPLATLPHQPRSPADGAAGSTAPPSDAAAGAPAAVPAAPPPVTDRPVGPALPDGQATVLGRARRPSAPAGHDAVPDEQATTLGRRNRGGAAADPFAEDGGEIVLRFGPGVPLDAAHVPSGPASAVPPAPARRPRRRRRAWAGLVALAAIVAVLLWLFLRPTPAPAVLAVRVHAPAEELRCGQTADLVGVVTTDGTGGPVTYRWLRSDGHDSGELVSTARRGERTLRVHLRWTVRGPGRFRGNARLRIAHRPRPLEAAATFSYACS
ncbi:hypothetical protein [Streptomyces sp. NPDC002671]